MKVGSAQTVLTKTLVASRLPFASKNVAAAGFEQELRAGYCA